MDVYLRALREAAELLLGLDPYIYEIIALSLRVSGEALLIAMAIGLPLGTWLGLARFPGRGLAIAFINTGLAVPPVVMGLLVFMFLSRKGPLGMLDLLYSPGAIVTAQIFLALPYMVTVTISAVGSVPRDFRLQALGLGATRWQALWLVLKEARVSLMVGIMGAFGAIISEVGAAMIVGGNIRGETQTLTTAIVQETRMGHFERGVALGLILLAFAFLATWPLTRIQLGRGGRWLQS